MSALIQMERSVISVGAQAALKFIDTAHNRPVYKTVCVYQNLPFGNSGLHWWLRQNSLCLVQDCINHCKPFSAHLDSD